VEGVHRDVVGRSANNIPAGGQSMRREAKQRGPGPSHVLMTPDHAGNVVGIDPHKRTLTATVVDARGGILAWAHFRVSGDGAPRTGGVGATVRADRPLGGRGLGELGASHGDVLGRPRP
jgi:hypothetical protein